MCTAFIKIENSKTFLALNRDESYGRSHTSIKKQTNDLFYGIDLKSKGTWFALDITGNFSVITNVRKFDLYKDDVRSRGELPLLGINKSPINHQDYNPYNLSTFFNDELYYLNYLDQNYKKINQKVFGISNGIHPNDDWEKVNKGQNYFHSLSLNDSKLFEKALKLMQDQEKFENLPQGTGASLEQEHFLSSIFLESQSYGTVSTTLALVDKNDIFLREINYINNTDQTFELTRKKI